MFSMVPSLLPALLHALSDKYEKVALLAVEVLAEFAAYQPDSPSQEEQSARAKDLAPYLRVDDLDDPALLPPSGGFFREFMVR